MKRNRTTLKGYFIKNAIPTEANFADLIDSMLNQNDDNIGKLPNDPLQITASGTEETLLNFYEIENDGSPTWQIKQKPAGKPGLSIGDTVASRFFIESGTGNVGIGTTEPGSYKLNLQGGDTNLGGSLTVLGAAEFTNNMIARASLQVAGTSTLTGNVGIGTSPAAQLHLSTGNPGNLSPYYTKQIQVDSPVDTGILLSTPTANSAYIYHNTPLDGASAGIKFDGASRYMSFFTTNGTERMRITTEGNVGIGTTTPSAKLEVAGDIKFGATLSTPGRMHITGEESLYLLNKSGVIIGKEWGGNGNLCVEGNVGVGTPNPAVPLHISGGVYRNFPNTSTQVFGLYVEQNAAAVYWHTTSDARVKLNPTPVDPLRSLNTLLDLTVYEYEYSPEYQPTLAGKRYHGFLAQDVEKVIPEAVSVIGEQKLGEGQVIEGLRVVANDRIFSETVGAIQAVYALVQQQESRLRELEGKRSGDQVAKGEG